MGLKPGLKFCFIAVLSVFAWIFNSLVCFLIDVVGSFLITVTRAVKKAFFFVFLFNPPPLLFLKELSFCKKNFFAYGRRKVPTNSNLFWLGFGVKQIMYIYCRPQTDCFVVSQLFSVTKSWDR